MTVRIRDTRCVGVASITANNVATFDFSSAPGGNMLIVACEAGGLMRTNVYGDDPQATITTLDSGDFGIFVDGGTEYVPLFVGTFATEISSVKIRPTANCTNVMVTLCWADSDMN